MLKFTHIFKNYYLGISLVGLLAFVIQEIPYIIMPLVKPACNPIMNMQNEVQWMETVQGIFGMLSMVLLMMLVRDDVSVFPVAAIREKGFFLLTLAMILINFTGWAFYYTGHQYPWLIVVSQFAAVPLYYLCYGLWMCNYPLVGTAAVFFLIHTANGYMNFIVKK